jgi:hypothetical protein
MFMFLLTFLTGPTLPIGYETVQKKHRPTSGRKEGKKLSLLGMKAVLSNP